jgi:hypothetical protein
MDHRTLVFWCVAMLTLSGCAIACSTIPNLDVKDYFKSADQVVLAEVVGGSRTAQSANLSDPPSVEKVQFKVLVTWKGSLRPGAFVNTNTVLGPGSCGLTVDPSLRVLIKTPPTTLKAGGIWVLFLNGSTPFDLSYGSGSSRLGDGGELTLGKLYRLAPRAQP